MRPMDVAVGEVVVDIPWTERAIGKEEVALLLGCEPRGVLERYACRPGFPADGCAAHVTTCPAATNSASTCADVSPRATRADSIPTESRRKWGAYSQLSRISSSSGSASM